MQLKKQRIDKIKKKNTIKNAQFCLKMCKSRKNLCDSYCDFQNF